MQFKYIAVGALTGIGIGILLIILFPSLLTVSYNFNMMWLNHQWLYSGGYVNYKTGSPYNVAATFPTLTGIGGGAVGFLLFKLKKSNSK